MGVLVPSGPGPYRFGHILVRDVLYAELNAAHRAQLHAALARSAATIANRALVPASS